MGKGAARELSHSDDEPQPLEEDLAQRLAEALEKIDRIKPAFKSTRDEERYAQMSKAWHRLCGEIDAHLRQVGKSIHASHQLSLDVGSDGGGINTKPFIEEISGAFERLVFRLEDTKVLATSAGRSILVGTVADVSYDWIKRAVVDWVVFSAENIRR